MVVFDTVYPGWYPGRTVHIHVKVHAPSWDKEGHPNTTHTFTSQLYFDQAINDHIATVFPNSNNTNSRTLNCQDMLFTSTNGLNTMSVKYHGNIAGYNGVYPSGWVEASVNLGVDKWW